MRIFFLIIFISFSNAFCQEVRFYPFQLFQFPQNLVFINPAAQNSTYKYEISLGRKGNFGEFNNTYVNYFNGQIKFFDKSGKHHNVGLNLVGYHDGQFLRKNLFQLNYAWHTPLSKKVSLGAGISLGAMNYSVLSTALTNGASSMAPDGNVGIWLYGKNYYAGASVNQIYNGKLVPYNEITRMTRHSNFIFGKKHRINHELELNYIILWRYIPKYQDNINVAINALIKEILLVGFLYQYKQGIAVTGGLENLKISDSRFRLLFSFQLLAAANNFNVHSYELGLGYYFKSKKRKSATD